VLRKRSSHSIPRPELRYYICSLSLKTVVYKGQLTADQLWLYFTDLKVSYFCTVFYSWKKCHSCLEILHKTYYVHCRGNSNVISCKSFFFHISLQNLRPIWHWCTHDSPQTLFRVGKERILYGKMLHKNPINIRWYYKWSFPRKTRLIIGWERGNIYIYSISLFLAIDTNKKIFEKNFECSFLFSINV